MVMLKHACKRPQTWSKVPLPLMW